MPPLLPEDQGAEDLTFGRGSLLDCGLVYSYRTVGGNRHEMVLNERDNLSMGKESHFKEKSLTVLSR